MYKVTIEKINQEKTFNNYRDAQKWMSETKKNWEAQINEIKEWNEERAFLIELTWDIKITKVTV